MGEDGRGGLKKEAPAVEGDGRLQRRRQKSGREIFRFTSFYDLIIGMLKRLWPPHKSKTPGSDDSGGSQHSGCQPDEGSNLSIPRDRWLTLRLPTEQPNDLSLGSYSLHPRWSEGQPSQWAISWRLTASVVQSCALMTLSGARITRQRLADRSEHPRAGPGPRRPLHLGSIVGHRRLVCPYRGDQL